MLSFSQRMLALVTHARTEQRAWQLEIKLINVNVPKDFLDQVVEKVLNEKMEASFYEFSIVVYYLSYRGCLHQSPLQERGNVHNNWR